jgi:hypothetical protein
VRINLFACVMVLVSAFFKDFHVDLAETVRKALRPHGMAFMLNPPRHGSLDRFADITRQVSATWKHHISGITKPRVEKNPSCRMQRG